MRILNRAQAANGAAAMEKPGGCEVDLMPAGTDRPALAGEDLLSPFQVDPALKRIPDLVASTGITNQRVDALLGLGARGCIKKPLQVERLNRGLTGIFRERAGEAAAAFHLPV